MKSQILTSLAAMLALAAPSLATTDCAVPTPISGSVLVPFDLSGGVLDGPGILQCSNPAAPFNSDFWFCWTSNVNGMVTISTCGLTSLDTGVAIYPAAVGCACPGDVHPLCCNDDAGGNCGKQSEVSCEVRCGERYMIQVAGRLSGTPPIGEVRINAVGTPCDGGLLTPPDCTVCCGTRPPLVDNLSAPFPPGQVGAVTFGTQDAIAGNIGVLRFVGLGDQSLAPLTSSAALWSPPIYAHPQWDLATLGSIFGVTFDGQGNAFVSHTVAYSFDVLGTLGVSTAGDGRGVIYRIDGATGVPTLFRTLPQAPGAGAALGLGNLDFDCTRECLFATNIEDGRIYSIKMGTGAISTFDHETGTVEAEAAAGNGDAIAEGPNPGGVSTEPAGFPGDGRGVYAVKVAGDRVYYSVWESYGSAQTVHSVQIDANGAFIAGSSRLELSIPYAPGHPYPNINSPIVDISFDDQCCMLLAERSMQDPTSPSAHNSRAWRACFDAAAAGWTSVRYDIGSQGQGTDFQNSAGGIDFVNGTNGPQAWMTGDFFGHPLVGSYYGISGIPIVEGNPGQLDTLLGPGVNMTGIKTMQGSLDITCYGVTDPCEFNTLDIDCVPNADGTMSFLWTLEIVNNSPSAANLLILSDPAFAPNNVIVINPPLASGGTMVINIPINNALPGSTFCFTATLAASYKDACCTEEICIELPECSCMDTDVVVTDLPGVGAFTFNMNLMNLSDSPVFAGEWISLAVAPGYTATVNPTLINIATLPLYSSVAVGPITISTALPPGSPIVLIIGLHSETFHPCCFREITLIVPAQVGMAKPGDANGDGVVDGSDLALLLSNWGLAGATDFNNDGTTDGQDLAMLLANWS